VIAAVLMAAGGGTRFTGPTHKLLAAYRGAPLWTWAYDCAVRAALDRTVVVTGAVPLDAPGATVLHNPRWADGMATSLALAVDWAGDQHCDAIVVGLADQPLIPSDAWVAVAAATDAPIAIATYNGQRGHPVRLAVEVWPLLPRQGDAGAKSVMRARPELVAEVACPGSPADVDTVEDLDQWR